MSGDRVGHLAILDGGLFSTLQDEGRFGWQRFGISSSGAMDRLSLRLANALVGNPPGEGVVEMTLSGLRFMVEAERCRIALAGADMPLAINGQPAASLQAYDLMRGDEVVIGRARSRFRAYLAVAGGFDVVPTLGSASTHTRSRIGGLDGGPLKAGGRLALKVLPASGPRLRLDAARVPGARTRLRVVMGPQAEAFTARGIKTFLEAAWRLSPAADRMGCVLEGPVIEHAGGFNIVSDGIPNGAIQISGHGQPIILLADRQTTGGYPKIATVIGPDLCAFAQMRPGDAFGFEAISAQVASQAAREFALLGDVLVAALEEVASGHGGLSSERLLALNLVGGVVSASQDPFSATE